MSDDDPADPFDRLDDGDANTDSGDPFSELDAAVDDVSDGRTSDEETVRRTGAEGDDSGPTMTEVDEPGVARDHADGGREPADAFERVDDGVHPEGEDDGVHPEGDPFERMRVTDVDVDDVWATIDEGETEPGMSGEAQSFEREHGREDHVVDKREYCQRCPFFSSPPEVACDREGTEIVEAMTLDEFRVRGCPMVAEEGPQFDSS